MQHPSEGLKPLCSVLLCLDRPGPSDLVGQPVPCRCLHIKADSNTLSLSFAPESLPDSFRVLYAHSPQLSYLLLLLLIIPIYELGVAIGSDIPPR